MIRHFLLCLILATVILHPLYSNEQDKQWWELRQSRADIYYPHEVHFEVMDEMGDSCMLCHAFSANSIHDEKSLAALTVIANEPLEAVCHSCHVDELRAPSRCNVCHTKPDTVWPEDHNVDYIRSHANDVMIDGEQCDTCHLDVTFCTDCHFGRINAFGRGHELGFMQRHGIEARFDSHSCSVCHNVIYCQDCHENR